MRIIDMIGVMPMPPAMNRKACALRASSKSLTGGATIKSSPGLTFSIRLIDPPRPASSRLTAI